MRLVPGRRVLAIASSLVFALTVAGSPVSAAQGGALREAIVVLRDGVDARSVAAEHANAHALTVGHIYSSALNGYSAAIPAAKLAAIAADPRVLFVSDDRPVQATAQTLPTGIDRIQADLSTQVSGNGSGAVSGVAVAVIDTGIDQGHPDLNVVGGVNCSSGHGFADGNGHGTHVAGTIGARDDASGVVGVAPGVPLYAVRVLNNQGSGSWSSVACGIDWVTAHASTIKVANMSLGGSGSDDGNCGRSNNDALHQAICNSVAAGVTYVVAAGNSSSNFSGFVPAAYNEVLTVTAIADYNGAPGGGAAATCRSGVDDTPADFSNFTSPSSADAGHTIAAPGVCILSTWKGGGYNTISGTSMATPHVTGTAALCIATGKCTGSPSQVIGKLRTDALPQSGSSGYTGVPSDRYYGDVVNAGAY